MSVSVSFSFIGSKSLVHCGSLFVLLMHVSRLMPFLFSSLYCKAWKDGHRQQPLVVSFSRLFFFMWCKKCKEKWGCDIKETIAKRRMREAGKKKMRRQEEYRGGDLKAKRGDTVNYITDN